MANLKNPVLYGYNFDEVTEDISLQWHLTVDCDQRCKHCYMFDSDTYRTQKTNQLSTEDAFKLVDEFYKLVKGYGTLGHIALTGGDPILSPNFWEILEYINKYKSNIDIRILGNPFHIDDEIAQRLKQNNVVGYQISLDGLKDAHDKMRKPGSFEDSLRALKCLHDAKIMTDVMFTVTRSNYTQLLELIKFINTIDYVDFITFDRMVPIGNGAMDELVDTMDYKKLLYEVHKYMVLKKPSVYIAKKDNLWKLLLYELGLTDPIDMNFKKICNGCSAGVNTLTVLADGTVYSCRRLDIAAGKFPEEGFLEIYFNSELYKNLKKVEDLEGCKDCELLWYCRGCPAIKYAVNGSISSKDSNCWKFI